LGYAPLSICIHVKAFQVPIAIEVFEGNTADPTTLKSQIEKLKFRFRLKLDYVPACAADSSAGQRPWAAAALAL
jgi:transposase